MTKSAEHANIPLTLRMTLGTAVMLIPLLIVGLGSLFTSQRMIGALEEVARTETREMRPVIDLQRYVLQAAMPPNDYIILGDISERDLFVHLAREIDRRFKDMIASPAFEEQSERNYIEA